jgi:hypothetical protein
MNQPSVWEIVSNSRWMVYHALDEFEFNEDTPVHIIFERILVNVAASYSYTWRDIYSTSIANREKYAARVISMILIYRALKEFAKVKDRADIISLLGRFNFDIMMSYYKRMF